MDPVTLGMARHYTDSQIVTVAADGLRAWGHSYAAGVNASPGAQPVKGFVPILAESLGLDLVTNAIGGTSLYYAVNNDSAWPSIMQNVTRNLQGRFSAPAGVTVCMYGINDVNKLGNTAAALLPYRNALRACVSRWRAGAIFEDSDPTVTYGSGWTVLGVTTANSGAGYKYNPTAGGTFTITTPPDFPGGTIALGFVGRSGGNGGVITSSLINGTAYTVDTRNNRTDSHLPYVLRIPNVPAGSAAYTFTTSSTQGPFGVAFDYWQWEPTDSATALVVLIKQPKPLDYTGYGATPPGPPTDAGIDALNQVITEVAAEFDTRVITVDTSAMDHDPKCFIAGNVHPTSNGHRVLAGIVRSAVLAKTKIFNSGRPTVAPREGYGTAAPTGTYISYAVGAIIWNTAPVASGTMGWVCVTAGTPGVWKTFGTIAA